MHKALWSGGADLLLAGRDEPGRVTARRVCVRCTRHSFAPPLAGSLPPSCQGHRPNVLCVLATYHWVREVTSDAWYVREQQARVFHRFRED